jgi:hypothetical protein
VRDLFTIGLVRKFYCTGYSSREKEDSIANFLTLACEMKRPWAIAVFRQVPGFPCSEFLGFGSGSLTLYSEFEFFKVGFYPYFFGVFD